MKTKYTFLSVILIIIRLCNLEAQDIRSSVAGVSLQFSGQFVNWTSTSHFLRQLAKDEPNGLGGEIRLAYGLNERISLMTGYGIGRFDKVDFWDSFQRQSISAGARLHFGATLQRLRPYLDVTVASESMRIDPIFFLDDPLFRSYDLKMNGLSFGVATGLHYFITPVLSINTMISLQLGHFDDRRINGLSLDLDQRSDFRYLSWQIGAAYFF